MGEPQQKSGGSNKKKKHVTETGSKHSDLLKYMYLKNTEKNSIVSPSKGGTGSVTAEDQ